MKLTPLKAIRKHCLWCANGSAHEVRVCPAETCPTWRLRFGKRIKGISSLKTIRKRCLDCSTFNAAEVRRCQFEDCPLFEYRLGHNPRLKGWQGGYAKKSPAVVPTPFPRAVSAPSGENTADTLPLRKAEETTEAVKSMELFEGQGVR